MFVEEKMLTLKEAAELVPVHPHLSTIWQWQREGIRGVRLESIRLGRRIYTSVESLNRFGEALKARYDEDAMPTKDGGLPRSVGRESEIERAMLRFADKVK